MTSSGYRASSTQASGAVSLFPEHFELFTACVGCAGIGGAIGGAIAMLAGEDIAKGGVMGATVGLALGAILVFLRGS
jgi:hypothetical protein